MPKRPIQHQLEDYSINQFKQLLPEKWIVREKDKDYGIDLEVEIVDSEDNATGEIFLVQLKATASKAKGSIRSVLVKIDTLKYYKKFQLPILLVRYSKDTKEFFLKWVNNIDLFYYKRDADKVKIEFNDNDKWDKQTIEGIEKQLKKFKLLTSQSSFLKLPVPISISAKESFLPSENPIVFEARISAELSKHNRLVILNREKRDALISIIIDREEIKINASELRGAVFHIPASMENEGSLDFLVETCLLGVSLILLQIGQFELSARIVIEGKLLPAIYRNESILECLLPALLGSSYVEEVIEGMDSIDNEMGIALLGQVATLFLRQNSSKKALSAIENVLKRRLERAKKDKDHRESAIAHYNLGNFFKGQGNYLKAINYYQLARKCDKIYLKQPYFFKELGGLFFLLERFSLSAKLYKYSLDLEYNPDILGTYGDALMFSGKYLEAQRAFTEYEKIKNPVDEFVLKNYMLKVLINENQITEQHRKIQTALSLSGNENGKPTYASLNSALQNDALCGLAWFNLGVKLKDDKRFSEAALAFTWAALVQTNDIEAWVNSAILMFQSKFQLELVVLSIRVAYFFNREFYLPNLLQLLSINELPDDGLNLIKQIIDELTSEIRNEKEPVEVRMLNEDGKFKDILPEIAKVKIKG